MNAIVPVRLGGIVSSSAMRHPLQGAQQLPVDLVFDGTTRVEGDLQASFQSGVFDFVQSVFIDNKDNAANLELTAPGLGNRGRIVRAQPYTQGWYPFTPPVGDGRFIAETTDGQTIPLIFSNVAMPYFTWGAVPGVLVVPTLTNAALNFAPLVTPANNILVAGAVAKTIKVYRLFYVLSAGATVQLSDSGGNDWTGDLPTTAGGGAAFQASGIPWFTTAAGADLVLTSDTAVNLGGAIGYVQS